MRQSVAFPTETETPLRPGRHTHTSREVEIEYERAGRVCHFVMIAPTIAQGRSALRRMSLMPAPLCGRSDGCAVDPRWLIDWTADVCELCRRRICRDCQERYGQVE
jgi:hypothetical protein